MFPATALSVCALGWAAQCQATIRYEVSINHPEQHLFHVTMTIPNVNGEVSLQIPAWNALYQIRDFASHIQRVEAFADSTKAPIEKVDKQTWRITGHGTITVLYTSYWDEVGPFATQLNADHAFLNPAMILFYVPERRSEDVHLSFPDVPAAWNAASSGSTGLESMGGARNFFFDAKSYD